MKPPEKATLGVELAQATVAGRTLSGYASVFNYPIDSGMFGMKQTTYIKPGAFTRTLKNNRDQIQVLVNHGESARYGMEPVAVVRDIDQDTHGLKVEADIIDDPFFDPLVKQIASGALRAMSIMFQTKDEELSDDRAERHIKEVKLYEFGPVTFPANEGSTLSVHAAFLGDIEMHWDGAAAMKTCSTAAEFRQIAFERNNDSDPDTAAHWTLPHHPRPGAGPDSGGVSAALAALSGARGGAPDLKQSVESVRAHLERHQPESSSDGARGDETRTLAEARLTWVRNASRTLEQHDAELEAIAARLAKLRES